MIEIDIQETETPLSRLLDHVAAGGEILISKAGQPLARLVPYVPPQLQSRIPGLDAGLVEIAEDFDASLPEDVIQAFES